MFDWVLSTPLKINVKTIFLQADTSDVYLGVCQVSMMEIFMKVIND